MVKIPRTVPHYSWYCPDMQPLLSSWWTVRAVRPCSLVEMTTSQQRTLLATRLSIPRVNIYKCDNCGDREKRKSLSDVHRARPHSVHVDQDNYLYLQHINEVRDSLNKQGLS